MKTPSLFFFLTLFLVACSGTQEPVTGILEDGNYTYFELKNTTEMSPADSVYKKLDSLEKRQLLPDITRELTKMDKDYLYSSFLMAYFVAKQKKVGNIQPILLKLFADDLNTTLLINLNEKNDPVSYLFVEGDEFCGSDHDSYCEKTRHSIFNNDVVLTYDLFKTESSNNEDISYTDSIVYKSIIQPDGNIETHRIDSVRVIKK